MKLIKIAKSKYFLLPGLSRKRMGLLKRKKNKNKKKTRAKNKETNQINKIATDKQRKT